MSTKRKFTPEEIKNLKANPYTLRVTEDRISYTLAFKEEFWNLSLQGYTTTMTVTSGIWQNFLPMNTTTI